ncbi:MAG: hypothetical protein ABIK53_07280 [bacterium]
MQNREILDNINTFWEEKIIKRQIVTAKEFSQAEKCDEFAADSHFHSYTQKFGLQEKRYGVFCFKEPIRVEFSIKRLFNSTKKRSRFLLKVVGMLKEWKKYTCPIEIKLNGKRIFRDFVFFENVCKGWPANYFRLPIETLKKGKNALQISNLSKGTLKENFLIVSSIEVIEKEPYEDFKVISCPEIVEKDSIFEITLVTLKKHQNVRVKCDNGIDSRGFYRVSSHDKGWHDRRSGPSLANKLEKPGKYKFLFLAKDEGIDKKMTICSESDSVKARIKLIYQKNTKEIPLWIGTDSDDHRHDESGQMEHILDAFKDTEMGNYIIFRPTFGRTYAKPASSKRWKRWINFCKDRNIIYRITSWPIQGNPVQAKFLKDNKCFKGIHAHEGYCFFQRFQNQKKFTNTIIPHKINNEEVIEMQKFTRAKTPKEIRNIYVAHLKSGVKDCNRLGFTTSWGEPSLLAGYIPLKKGDVIQAEPVTNVSLLFGAVRATCQLRKNLWGAHIAIDWYLGFPHDGAASRRFSLLLNLVYTYGGNYAYTENSLFKTNAYERFDEEDEFPRKNRNILRNFYRISRLHPRQGKPYSSLAVLYGNLEYMLWLPGDKMPEVSGSKKWKGWNATFWGKWKENRHMFSWKAIDGWLPPLPIEEYKDNPSIRKLFCGTPYGQADIPPSDISLYSLCNYKCVVLLGWNTMTEELYTRLKEYVERGGILYISACHFDTRINPEAQPRIFRKGKIREFIGADIKRAGKKIKFIRTERNLVLEKKIYQAQEETRICELVNLKGRVLASDQNKNPVLLENKLGKGIVYFGAFYDFPAEDGLVEFNRDLLSFLGEKFKEDFGIEGTKNINYVIWRENNSKAKKEGRMYLVNVNWKVARNEETFSMRLWGKKYPCIVREGLIRDVLWTDDIALSLECSGVRISSLSKSQNSSYIVELKGLGKAEITGFLKTGRIKKIINSKGGKYKLGKAKENNRTFFFSADVEGNLKFEIDIV